MVAFLLGLIACILLFGAFGLVVFAAIMTCVLPFYIVFIVLKMVFGHKKKRLRKDSSEEKRCKTVLVKEGEWVGNRKSRKF